MPLLPAPPSVLAVPRSSGPAAGAGGDVSAPPPLPLEFRRLLGVPRTGREQASTPMGLSHLSRILGGQITRRRSAFSRMGSPRARDWALTPLEPGPGITMRRSPRQSAAEAAVAEEAAGAADQHGRGRGLRPARQGQHLAGHPVPLPRAAPGGAGGPKKATNTTHSKFMMKIRSQFFELCSIRFVFRSFVC